MIFAILKDTHFRFAFPHPRGRTPDFETQIKNKLMFVVEKARELNCDNLILTGDSTDIKSPSSYGLEQVRANVSVYKYLKKHFNQVFDIAGNHSLPFSSVTHKPESFYQYLVDNELIQDLSTQPFTFDNVHLYGLDYTSEPHFLLHSMKLKDKYCLDNNLKAIAVIHEHLVPSVNDKERLGHCFTYSEVTDSLKAHKAIIAGHLHKGFKNHIVNDCLIINIWNFTRLARDYYVVNELHTPQVAFLNTDDFSCEVFNIPSEPFNSAFIKQDLQRETSLDLDITSFVNNANIAKASNEVDNSPAHIKNLIDYYLEKASLMV